jgi:hypothetical protein
MKFEYPWVWRHKVRSNIIKEWFEKQIFIY